MCIPNNFFQYFVDYKLGEDYTNTSVQYSAHFMQYIGFAAQIPNLFFNWMNIFLNIGGNITGRIVWTLFVNILVFVFTIVLAMVDSSEWPGIFFYLTVGSVVILNSNNYIPIFKKQISYLQNLLIDFVICSVKWNLPKYCFRNCRQNAFQSYWSCGFRHSK